MKIDDSLTWHIGFHNKALPTLPSGAAKTLRAGQRDEVQKAAAMIVLALDRSHSDGCPAMNRDQLLSVAAMMTKSPLTAMGSAGPLTGTDAKVDTKHFGGRHTREFCGLPGR